VPATAIKRKSATATPRPSGSTTASAKLPTAAVAIIPATTPSVRQPAAVAQIMTRAHAGTTIASQRPCRDGEWAWWDV